MANEILTSNLERVDSILSSTRLLLLADRAIMGAHPAILEAGDVAGTGSNVIKVRRLGLDGYNALASATEIQDLTNIAFVDASTNVTVGRYSVSHDASTISMGTDPELDWARFAQSLLTDALTYETTLAAALATGFSDSLGTDATEMSLTTLLTATSTLEAANVSGPYLFVGHSAHIRGLRLEQLLGVAGQMQYQPPAGVQVGTGYKGRVPVIDVDVFQTNRSPSSGSGYAGMLVGQGAIARAHMTPPVSDPSRQRAMGNILIEYGRDPGATIDQYHAHLYVGFVENDDARGVQIICKA